MNLELVKVDVQLSSQRKIIRFLEKGKIDRLIVGQIMKTKIDY